MFVIFLLEVQKNLAAWKLFFFDPVLKGGKKLVPFFFVGFPFCEFIHYSNLMWPCINTLKF